MFIPYKCLQNENEMFNIRIILYVYCLEFPLCDLWIKSTSCTMYTFFCHSNSYMSYTHSCHANSANLDYIEAAF